MNLRQRIKCAKKEVEIINNKSFNSLLERVNTIKRKHDLLFLINCKKKRHTHEQYDVDKHGVLIPSKITYIQYVIGYDTLALLESVNGKSLSKLAVSNFINTLDYDIINNHIDYWGNMTKYYNNHYITHELVVSTDRTKSKKLLSIPIFSQEIGSFETKPTELGEVFSKWN